MELSLASDERYTPGMLPVTQQAGLICFACIFPVCHSSYGESPHGQATGRNGLAARIESLQRIVYFRRFLQHVRQLADVGSASLHASGI